MTKRTALVAGVGPGLGAAVARRLAGAGMRVALGARHPDFIAALAAELNGAGAHALAVPYDVGDEAAVAAVLSRVEAQLGPVRVLVYNAGNMVAGGVEAISPEAFLGAWRTGPYGAFLHVRRLAPAMAEAGGGALIFTGATSSVRASASSPAFAAAKFGLRGLAQSLARAWGPKGVHVAHVILDGVVRTPQTAAWLAPEEPALEPDDVAAVYLRLIEEPPSAWTFELDLRPQGEAYLEN